MTETREAHQVPDELPVPPLAVLVPPMLEAAFGWAGEARYVAFFWTPHGDELCFATGRESGTLAGWWSWVQFTRHAAVARVLRLAISLPALGSSESIATHWMVLDRLHRQLCVLPQPEAAAFLARQWPVVEHPPFTVANLAELEALAREVVRHLQQQAETMLEAQPQAALELTAWLADHGG